MGVARTCSMRAPFVRLAASLGFFACTAAAVALGSPSPTPAPRLETAAPLPLVPSPSPRSTPRCDKQQMVFGEMTLCTYSVNFDFKSGDLQFPRELEGRTADGTYRADRGYGNLHAEIINLIGHVVIHRDASKDSAGKPVAPITINADQAHIESKAKYYRASGNVKIVQADMTLLAPLVVDDEAHRTLSATGGATVFKGDKKLTAPQIVLDETTHVATLTGGVHAEEGPTKSFDSAEVIYNTATEEFKALGGVRMQFPAQTPSPSPSPRAKTTGGPKAPSAAPSASAPGAGVAPKATIAPSPSASESP
jgi:lipopolysaccharide export system protein LptA